MDPSDRRRHQRLRIDGRMAGRATLLADFRIVALSEVGSSLEMALPMAMGSECHLTLNLPHSSVELRGRVVHLEARNPNEQPPWLVGVDFESIDAMDQALLQSFLEHERRRAL